MQQSLPNNNEVNSDDLDVCRALLRGGSRTFHAASKVLPRNIRDAATALYAFCRVADDAIDLSADHEAALIELRTRLHGAYAGRPADNAVDRAFAGVVTRYGIPRALPEALLEGFQWDAAGRRYETLNELQDYAARVAGTVGAMMALLMGEREPDTIGRACDLGTAMQLTNIARDVGEDARLGRLYLPLDWLREAGIDPQAWLAQPEFAPALGAVVSRLLAAADELYVRSELGISRLPAACRPGMYAARLLYAEIGREVERRGCDSVTSRAIVTPQRKAQLLLAALTATARAAQREVLPALQATQFLVDAVAAHPLPKSVGFTEPQVAWWNIADRLVKLIDLFERLERRQRLSRTSSCRNS